MGKGVVKHGDFVGHRRQTTPEYNSYFGAKQRCQYKNHIGYARYGGRGIEFRFASFAQFLEEVGRKPTPEHSLDRIDNDGHYEPGNVRWATRIEQMRNTVSKKTLKNGLAEGRDSVN